MYPDFIFAVQQGDVANRVVVLEMKGKDLAGNDDTDYKKAVLNLMTSAYAVEQVGREGELELVVEDGTSVECDLVLMPDWKTNLPKRVKAKLA